METWEHSIRSGPASGASRRRSPSGEASAVEVAEAHVARMEALEPELNAFITRNARAVEDARQSRPGPARGRSAVGQGPDPHPGHADHRRVEDLRQETAGPGDAPVARKLRRAGAVLLGKTNLHELAMGVTTVNEHLRTGAESLGYLARGGRLQRRLRGGGRGGNGSGVGGQRYPRIDPHSRGLLRHHRTQADLRAHRHRRRRSPGRHARSPGPDDALGGGRGTPARRHGRQQAERGPLDAGGRQRAGSRDTSRRVRRAVREGRCGDRDAGGGGAGSIPPRRLVDRGGRDSAARGGPRRVGCHHLGRGARLPPGAAGGQPRGDRSAWCGAGWRRAARSQRWIT